MWNENLIPDQTGKVFLITGANSGLGFETTKTLLNKGATVIMACKSKRRGEVAKQDLLSTKKSGILDLIELDLADMKSVNNASNFILSEYKTLNVLINNAGVMAPPRTLSKQGLEIQFAVNHIGHMLLTNNLLKLINKSSGSRIVTVTSAIQYLGEINWNDLQGSIKYDKWFAYAQSKLANVMFALKLGKILNKSYPNIISVLAHPGIAKTNLQRNAVTKNKFIESLSNNLISPFMQSAQMGASSQIYASTMDNVKNYEQYGPKYQIGGSPRLCNVAKKALNMEDCEKLWNISIDLINNKRNKK